ncbi:MAG: hypothetical protein WA303_10965 [Bradyrhizobium sp.]|jgi:hypothetical protein
MLEVAELVSDAGKTTKNKLTKTMLSFQVVWNKLLPNECSNPNIRNRVVRVLPGIAPPGRECHRVAKQAGVMERFLRNRVPTKKI